MIPEARPPNKDRALFTADGVLGAEHCENTISILAEKARMPPDGESHPGAEGAPACELLACSEGHWRRQKVFSLLRQREAHLLSCPQRRAGEILHEQETSCQLPWKHSPDEPAHERCFPACVFVFFLFIAPEGEAEKGAYDLQPARGSAFKAVRSGWQC